jgi:hypothetical protein
MQASEVSNSKKKQIPNSKKIKYATSSGELNPKRLNEYK